MQDVTSKLHLVTQPHLKWRGWVTQASWPGPAGEARGTGSTSARPCTPAHPAWRRLPPKQLRLCRADCTTCVILGAVASSGTESTSLLAAEGRH